MKLTFTQAILICFLFLFFGCSPKQIFYLNKGTGSFGAHQKVQQEQPGKWKAPGTAPETNKSGNTSRAVALSASASNQPQIQVATSSIQERIVQAELESFKRYDSPNRQEVKTEQKISRKRELLKKKFLAAADDRKPNHKAASIGFLLSLGGLLLILTGLFMSAAGPILLGILLGIGGIYPNIRGLSKIKQEPDKYGGRGLSITGLVLSGLILLASIAFILYIMAFAGAFS